MATANRISGITASPARPGADLLVLLSSMPQEQFESVLDKLNACFSSQALVIVTPDPLPEDSFPSLRFLTVPATNRSWTLTAADYANAYQLAGKNEARSILMLGPEAGSLSLSALADLANAALTTSTDLAVPRYDLPPHGGMINSAILYPLTRALFGSRVRFPLALDLGLSLRMAERLAGIAGRFTPLSQSEALIWPINEAMVAGFLIDEFDAGPRTQPQPPGTDLSAILPLVTGSLFSNIDANAAFWQRSRQLPPVSNPIVRPLPMTIALSADATAEIASMLQAFHLAYTNLDEVWRLVLPPSSLLGLKRLSATDGAAFRMPDNLWARIVFDFLLAYRLRTINRGHLLGALIPIYHAWVASHLNIIASGIDPEHHIEAVAAAFEADKTYIVSRWRWPDRFNP